MQGEGENFALAQISGGANLPQWQVKERRVAPRPPKGCSKTGDEKVKDELFELSAEEIAAVSGGSTEETTTTERGGKYVLAGG